MRSATWWSCPSDPKLTAAAGISVAIAAQRRPGHASGAEDTASVLTAGADIVEIVSEVTGVKRTVTRSARRPDDALVVSGDRLGHISCRAGCESLEELASTPDAFANGQLSVTTVGEIRAQGPGWDVVPTPRDNNVFHADIITPSSAPRTAISADDASLLSKLFTRIKNIFR